MNDKYFIDTNMLLYLINPNELQKHKIIAEFIKNKNCEISIQNLKELSNILFKKTTLSASEIKKYILNIGTKFPLCLESPTDIIDAIDLVNNKQNFYDTLLVATMLRNETYKIITENEKDFANFKKIKVINPFK